MHPPPTFSEKTFFRESLSGLLSLAFVPDNGFKSESVCQLKWVYSITQP